MSKFIKGQDRSQGTLFPERLDDYVEEDSPVRVIDVFIDDLDISGLGFKAEPATTGRPGYHPKTMLKLYVYGYLNRVQSSRRLEVEAQRNIELMWFLLGNFCAVDVLNTAIIFRSLVEQLPQRRQLGRIARREAYTDPLPGDPGDVTGDAELVSVVLE